MARPRDPDSLRSIARALGTSHYALLRRRALGWSEEEIRATPVAPRRCRHCREPGHDGRSCPDRPRKKPSALFLGVEPARRG